MTARLELPIALLLAVAVRVPFWVEALRTPVDGDTAIIGLMARHPGRGTTMWGQPYGSPVEAWVAAPLFAAMGADAATLRLAYFLLGLGLVPASYLLARALDPRAALFAAIIVACPPPYMLLLSALPPPMYPAALLLGAAVLALALALGERLEDGRPTRGLALGWGIVAGLALWTHLMSAAAVVPALAFIAWRARPRWRVVALALFALAASSAPWWTRVLLERDALRMVSVSSRREGLGKHLAVTLPRLHEPVGGLLGTHFPVVADDAEHVVRSPPLVAAALVFVYGLCLVGAARAMGMAEPRERARVMLLFAAAVSVVIAFPFPLRSGPSAVRFLTPAYLPVVVLVAWTAVRHSARRAWIVALGLAALHLGAAGRLLAAWRTADRAAAPFLLPDLGPARAALEAHGVRHAYASYGPAYRLTFETGERVIASQPWNERFLHYPLPYLDEVRFAKNVAWVLTPGLPTDLPAPRVFEDALGRAGGGWRRTEVKGAVVYDDFRPPLAPLVERLTALGAAGDGDPSTAMAPHPVAPLMIAITPPRALDALTLFSGAPGPRLLRSMDVEVSADGRAFEVVAQRRRRDERADLRWVNGHPQYVIDHDVVSIPLDGRTVAAVVVKPVESNEPWKLGEVLLHPASPAGAGGPSSPQGRAGTRLPRGGPWDEWLDPNLSWDERARALRDRPRPDRADWYYRWGIVARRR